MTDKPGFSIRRCPCVIGTMAWSILFSAAYFRSYQLDFAMAESAIWNGQFWRFLTSCFIHGDILHLAFNLYWLFELGRPIEARYGSLRTGLIMVFLGAGSGAAQFLVSDTGGIGLSGVGYGFLGLLWAMRDDPRGTGYSLTTRTIALFVGWFFICLATTFASIWSVGNMAHASGLVLGFAMGRALVSDRPRLWVSVVTAAVVLPMAATLYMPWSYRWWWHHGSEALERGDQNRSRAYWVRAVEVAGNDREVEPLLEELGHEAFSRKDLDGAIEYYRRAMAVSGSSGIPRAYLAYALFVKGDLEKAYESAGKLSDSDLDPFLRAAPSFMAFVTHARTSRSPRAYGATSRPGWQTSSRPPSGTR